MNNLYIDTRNILVLFVQRIGWKYKILNSQYYPFNYLLFSHGSNILFNNFINICFLIVFFIEYLNILWSLIKVQIELNIFIYLYSLNFAYQM